MLDTKAMMTAFLGLAAMTVLLSVSVVFGGATLPSSSGGSPLTSSILNNLGSFTPGSNVLMYAGLFAVLVFVIFSLWLKKTTLSGGSDAIALVIAAITFIFMYTNPAVISLFLQVFVITILSAILLLGLLITARQGIRFHHMLAIVALMLLFWLILENDAPFNAQVNAALGVNLALFLPFIIAILFLLTAVIGMAKVVKNTDSALVKVLAPIEVILLFILLFVAPSGAFLLATIGIGLFLGILIVIFGREGSGGSSGYKA